MTTELQSKTYRFTYTKRVIVGDGYTVPYVPDDHVLFLIVMH